MCYNSITVKEGNKTNGNFFGIIWSLHCIFSNVYYFKLREVEK